MTETPDTSYRAQLIQALQEVQKKVARSIWPSRALLHAQEKLLTALEEHDRRPDRSFMKALEDRLDALEREIKPIVTWHKIATAREERQRQLRIAP